MTSSNIINYTSLWMGDLDGTMSENDISEAFKTVGEPAIGVKFIRDKNTNSTQPYCFVNFQTMEDAQRAMRKLNGKRIPNFLHKTFRLNLAQFGKESGVSKIEFSLYVGNLSPEVDEGMLEVFFSSRFKTVKEVKVVKDPGGVSRGFGFVRFFNEDDQISAVKILNGAKGLGQRPVVVSKAVPKQKEIQFHKPSQQDYAQQHDYYNYYNYQYQQQYNTYYSKDPWAAYQHQQEHQYNYQYDTQTYSTDGAAQSQQQTEEAVEDEELEEYIFTCDVEALNKECIQDNQELYKSLENSRWHCVDTMNATVDDVCVL